MFKLLISMFFYLPFACRFFKYQKHPALHPANQPLMKFHHGSRSCPWNVHGKPLGKPPGCPNGKRASRPPRSFHPSQGLGRSEWDFRQNYNGYGYVYTYMYMIVYVYIFIYSLIYGVYLSIDWFIQLFAIYSFIIFIYWFILLYIYISIHISMYLYIIINNCI